ncbi:alpha-amylase [Bacillus massiliglaciei]|uniref:alpha-amylase n=1 Tax=Bacillus massiliglaciei TaxID=1816693 RepID=UPI000B121469|nr:alpha-amylase [Bacillus massiliglaciei]
MKRNHTMMQFFEWHLEADGSHWKRLKKSAPLLKEAGIDCVWIPPVTKGITANDVGYGIYDLYDLGEFDQKGTVRTKYGTKHELLEAIEACHNYGIAVYVDLVMNHKAGADETERFEVVEVNPDNRNEEISESFEINGWTKFNFEGRSDQYSDFKWNHHHFNGTDYDEEHEKMGIYRILGEHKGWSQKVSQEFGNYDYLMFANIDYSNPDVRKEMISWAKWLVDALHCEGFRLDAVKHIDYDFMNEFLTEINAHTDDNFFMVGEYWKPDVASLETYLKNINYGMDLFDVALHYKFYEASNSGAAFDLSSIFQDTLVQSNPTQAVTFVDNHDSQPHEALESWVKDWFKPHAYSLILLRLEGYPCVFYGDYYGIGGPVPIESKKEMLDHLLCARHEKSYGEQIDYFDDPNVIGWVRLGTEEMENSGCAVVMTNADEGEKRMFVGEHRAGEIWTDMTRSRDDQIQIEEDGWATFPVNPGSVAVWALDTREF